ncbi:MAG TPA: hypothetical protein VK550_33860 [Polyangiaceae bacterium]|nr:hypothetical protein [Polyangiaceae bacterium]
MSRTLVMCVASALVCLSACEPEKIPEPTAAAPSTKTAPVASVAATVAPAPAAAIPAAENIPVAADFEDDAEEAITKANYKTELSALEAEIK